MVKIFYRHIVVGGVVNCTNDIYGGRTHSACRYNAYICIYNCNNTHTPHVTATGFLSIEQKF